MTDDQARGETALFARRILDLCREHACSITSWYRTPARNRAIGGASASLHLQGLAADLDPDDETTIPALVDAATVAGLYTRPHRTYCHVQARPLKDSGNAP